MGFECSYKLMDEDIEESNQLRTEFLSMTAHEMGTALNVIYGYMEVLTTELGTSIPCSCQEIFSIVQSQIERMSILLRDLEDYDQIERGMISFKSVQCDLKEILEKAMVSLALVARRKGLRVQCEYPNGSLMIYVDPTRVQQIIYNLITNAIKYSQNNGFIRISTRLQQDSAIFEIQDNGPGIAEDDLDRIFLPHYRTAVAKSVPGVGLGLYISKILVEALGGKIHVESEMGVGTIFTVHFPTRALH